MSSTTTTTTATTATTTLDAGTSSAGGKLTAVEIPCCLCGTMILPNAANQCPTCLAQQVDLRGMLQRGPGGDRHSTVYQCRRCRRYRRSEKCWEHADLESPALLSICLKQIPALSSSSSSQQQQQPPVHLVDAGWIWTEPHSMRLVLQLTVRAEIQQVTVQQRVAVKLHVKFQQCPDCNRTFTNRTWHAVVQLRQVRADASSSSASSDSKNSAPNKTGLAALEMALAKNDSVRRHVLSVDTVRNGFDFYFDSLAKAQQFAQFCQRVAPMRAKTSQKLVSTDVKNNTAHVKHTVSCDLVPLCRDDLVVVHKSVRGAKLSGRLVLVTKVSSVIHLMDASPKRQAVADGQMELSPEAFYKQEKSYSLLQTPRRLTRFVVLDVELCDEQDSRRQQQQQQAIYKGPHSGVEKFALADVLVARESEFGTADEQQPISVVTHLGHLLQVGDTVMGYDLMSNVTSGMSDVELEESLHHSYIIPDVVLVKKVSSGGANSGGGGDGDGDANGSTGSTRTTAEQEHRTSDGDKNGGPRQQKTTRNKNKPLTKKQEKRKRRKEGKKMRELEASAARMGFLDDDDADDHHRDDNVNDDNDEQAGHDDNSLDNNNGNHHHDDDDDDRPSTADVVSSSFASELNRDPKLASELEALEQ